MPEAACTASACTVYQKIMISDDRQVQAIPATQYIIYKVVKNTKDISSVKSCYFLIPSKFLQY